jgi:hypothetical protein
MKYLFATYGILWLFATAFLLTRDTPVATTFEGLMFLFWLAGVFPVAPLAIAHFENPRQSLDIDTAEIAD